MRSHAHITIFAHGPACSPRLRTKLRRGRFTIALDGGAEEIRRQNWRPDLISGDFDSASPATLRFFEKKGTLLLHTPDQNYSDLEKALAYCMLHRPKSIWIAQAFGDRVDHSLVNLSLLQRFHRKGLEIFLIQENERVRFLRDEKIKLSGRKGRRIAVLPFPKCVASSQGLQYELRKLSLELGERESSSNSALRRDFMLSIKGAALLVEAN